MARAAKAVFVHGAWADATSWDKVLPLLSEAGVTGVTVQLPLTSLAEDAAVVKATIAREDGPLLLVGHSYGGVVITQAGSDPKVAGLVFIAAFAPDIGESAGALTNRYPPSLMNAELRLDDKGVLTLTRDGVFEGFAQDLSDAEKTALFEHQAPTAGEVLGTPVTVAAWKKRPNWYLVATEDNAIPPSLQRNLAERLRATTASTAASHVAMLSQPRAVADLVIQAAAK